MVKVVKHLPRGTVESPSWKIFKIQKREQLVLGDPALRRGLELDGLQRSLPTSESEVLSSSGKQWMHRETVEVQIALSPGVSFWLLELVD